MGNRRFSFFGLLSILVPVALAVPAVSVPRRAAAVAVPPSVHMIPLVSSVASNPAPVGSALVSTEEMDVAPFSALGLSWEHDPQVGRLEAQVRVRSAGRWSAWQAIETDDIAPDEGSRDAGPTRRDSTEMLWVGDPANAVQVHVPLPAGHAPMGLQLVLIDPGRSPHDAELGVAATRGPAAVADVPYPPIISRAEWGADESLRGANGDWCLTPAYTGPLQVGFVHHTVSRNDYGPDQAAAIMRSIYAYHVRADGWCDIGYNFLVDRFGRIFEGRWGGPDQPVLGTHTYGFNTDTFAVSMIGTFTDVAPSKEARDAVAHVLAWKLGMYGRDLLGKAWLTAGGADKFAAGQPVLFDVISAHRDANITECPGAAAYALLPEIRYRTLAHSGLVTSLIALRWLELGGETSFLGNPVSPELDVPGGRATYFQGGALFWSPATGVHEVHGAILDWYRSVGATASPFGFPVGDEAPAGRGSVSAFQFGSAFWSAESGAHGVLGEILARYLELGGPGGPLGFPTSDEHPVTGGRASDFERARVYWSPETGAHGVAGEILARYLQLGGPDGALGLPTSDEYPVTGGRASDFQRGRFYWSPETGAHELHGRILARYLELGGPDGALGLPTSEEYSVTAGRAANFRDARLYWSPPTGGHAVSGEILARYLELGGPDSPLGLPTSDEFALTIGRESDFQHGALLWLEATHTVVLVPALPVPPLAGQPPGSPTPPTAPPLTPPVPPPGLVPQPPGIPPLAIPPLPPQGS